MLDDKDLGISTSAEMARVDKLCAALNNKKKLISRIKKETVRKPKKKVRVKVPRLADIIAHTRNSKKSTIRYFTKGHKISRRRNVFTEPSPFRLPSENVLSNLSFKSSETKPIRPKHAYMKGWKTDIFERLYIPDSKRDIPVSKLDYDRKYFTLVKGRPIREHFDRHHFAANHRKCFFKKLCAGFLEDEIKRQEEHHIRDLWHMFNIREELDKIIQSFENYLAEDHQESVHIIEEAQQIAFLKDQKVYELKQSSGYMNAIKCSLYKMEEDLSYRKYCKEAIYKISPTSWQEEFEATKALYKAKAIEIAEEVHDHYQDFQMYTPEQDQFLDQLVADLVADIVNMGPPIIYFKQPWEVDLVFKEFELQNLHAAKHLADVGTILQNLKSLLKQVKDYYKNEFACLQEKIQDLEAGIKYQKERSLELECIANDLTNTVYRDVISGDHILETYGLIQDLYDEIVGDDDTKLTCTEMMELIEEEIADVWQKAQRITRTKYEVYEKKVAQKTAQEFIIASKAKRREREVVLTLDRLTRSYLPPQRQLWKKLYPRSDPPPMRRKHEYAKAYAPKKKKPKKMEKKKEKKKVTIEVKPKVIEEVKKDVKKVVKKEVKKVAKKVLKKEVKKESKKKLKTKPKKVVKAKGKKKPITKLKKKVKTKLKKKVKPKLKKKKKSVKKQVIKTILKVKKKKLRSKKKPKIEKIPRLQQRRRSYSPVMITGRVLSEDSELAEIFKQRLENDFIEEDIGLTEAPEYKFDFTELYQIHENLMERIRKYELYGRAYFDEMMAEEEDQILDHQTSRPTRIWKSIDSYSSARVKDKSMPPDPETRQKISSDISVLPVGGEDSDQFSSRFEQLSGSKSKLSKEVEDLIESFPKVPSQDEFDQSLDSMTMTEAESN